jgi:hypothetical protein
MSKNKSKPTVRTLDWLRYHGQISNVVEHRVPHANITRDLIGADILSFGGDQEGVNLWQTTSGDHAQKRIRKLLENDEVKEWVKDPKRRMFVIAWRQLKEGGWTPKLWRIMPTATGLEAKLIATMFNV